MKKKYKSFDRYEYYLKAVQSPQIDCQFVADTYRQLRKKTARALREDFCGTFAICCEWARRHRENRAYGIDLDPDPTAYGRKHYLSKMRPDQQRRVQITQGSVLTARVPKVDVVLAMNFSYYLFQSRAQLKKYFARARKGLKRDGLMIVDCFGGKEAQAANEEVTQLGHFKYYWDQVNFDPVHNHAIFHIHFKRKGEAKREKVFSYDWRLWTIPEIRETMTEVGFRKTHVYWEGTTRSGAGDGKFKRTEVGEDCDAWIAYVVGEV